MTPPLPLAEAQARLLAMAGPLAPEAVAVEDALGRFLAHPLAARRTQPAADLSAMDGYALPGSELGGPELEGPWRVIGESAAGHPFHGAVGPGEAVRISTGALMPEGADTVLLQEDTEREGDTLRLTGEPPRPGRHIRKAGFDFREGQPVLPAGARITAASAALAISAGHSRLPVFRRPKLAIIDSGDELAADPAVCGPHQVPASNGAMLALMAAALPCETTRLGPVRDDLGALAEALGRAGDADLIVTSGGASVGDHDLIRPALQAWGADIAFWRVAMKPGKPLLVARRGDQFVLGLPGNPVSSYVTAYFFLLPLLRRMLGAATPLPARLVAPAGGAPLGAGGKRLEFLRAHWDGARVTPVSEQDSSALLALANANALIERPAGAPEAAIGGDVPFYLIENGGIA